MEIDKTKTYLYVDGYNIINSWERFSQLKNENLEDAREELIDILAEYQIYSDYETVLVFDAYKVKDGTNRIEYKRGLKIVYTEEKETADHYIEKMAEKIARKTKMIVATSDHLEQTMVMAKGAIRMSARELELEINMMKDNLNITRESMISKVDYEFGELDDNIKEILKNIKFKKSNKKKSKN